MQNSLFLWQWCTSSLPLSEPPGPPTGVQVRADSSESITVLWSEPEVTNGAISNYSVVCFNNNTRETIINKTVTIVQAQTEFFLEPDTMYICSVIAFNIHGPSLPQRAVGTTLPITSKLITSWKCVVYYNNMFPITSCSQSFAAGLWEWCRVCWDNRVSYTESDANLRATAQY